MASILNNVAALGASRQLGITNAGLNRTIERLTTGRRINRASDDAAGLAISNALGADIRVAAQGKRNANDGISYLQVADGVTDEITSLLTRAAELAEQSATGTVDNTVGRAAIDAEYQNIKATISAINVNTKFNGVAVFGSTLSIQAGDLGTVVAVISSVSTGALGVTGALTTASAAATELTAIRSALNTLSTARGAIGAAQQQLSSNASALGIQVENFTSAFSQIRDADIADEVVSLTKFQVLNQSGVSSLSQANQASQSILALLR